MRRLIRADLKRIVVKPSMYVVVVIMALFVLLKEGNDTVTQQMEFYKLFYNTAGLTFVCIPIFLSVYADEIKSGIMISVIGMGLPRKKIVEAKLWDSFWLLMGSYLVLFLVAVLKNSIVGYAISPKQNVFLLLFCMFCVIRGIGIIALSSLVLFFTMSATGGMLILIMAGISAAGLLKALQDSLEIPVYDFSYVGLLDTSFADFQNGTFGGTLILALLYLLVVVVINIKTFERKEMDL